jgi:hypothetical protein
MSKKKKSGRTGMLQDHKRQGKQFLPPLVAALGNKLAPLNWVDELLPEVLWIELLRNCEPTRWVHLALETARASHGALSSDPQAAFAKVSDYYGLTEEDAAKARDAMRTTGILASVQHSLLPLIVIYPECPMKALLDIQASIRFAVPEKEAIEIVKAAIKNILDRRSKAAMWAQATIAYITGALGMVLLPEGTDIDLNSVKDYPDTDESRMHASSIRAMASALMGPERDSTWPNYFWRRGYEVDPCSFFSPAEGARAATTATEAPTASEIKRAIGDYSTELSAEVHRVWNSMKVDLAKPMRQEVLGGLLARQVRLAAVISEEPILWSVDLGRIMLRCMVDTHINMVWLGKVGSDKHFKKFVEYGLGQEKLLLAHLADKTTLTQDPAARRHFESTDHMRDWVSSQLLPEFLPVDVGSWNDKNVRIMAKDIGAEDVYKLAYSPFSSVVHGMWNAIARLNLKVCINPLHKFHRVPDFREPPLYLGTLLQAAKIMDGSLQGWCSCVELKTELPTVSSRLHERLSKILAPEIAVENSA